MTRTDAELHRRVLAELESEPCLWEQEIGIAVAGGVVTLSGQVESCAHKLAAERAAARVSGVTAVAEELEVHQGARSHERSDTEIAHLVAEFLMCLHLPGGRVKARIERGWVTLEGEVELPAQKFAAEKGVNRLAGVRGVINLITVGPSKTWGWPRGERQTAAA